jgi:hypothetical protein
MAETRLKYIDVSLKKTIYSDIDVLTLARLASTSQTQFSVANTTALNAMKMISKTSFNEH